MNPRTILVVEDDSNDENLTLRALRGVSVPCSVVVARSGADALDYLLRRGEFDGRRSANPDVVFLDNAMPGMPGNELVGRIRSETALEGVPLVIFSGTTDETLIANCLGAGANAFLEKPVDTADYLSNVRTTAEYWLSKA